MTPPAAPTHSLLARAFPRMAGLWAVARDRTKPATTRRFAWAELVFFPLSLLTVAALAAFAVLRVFLGWPLPDGWPKVALTLLASGAVGYLTNYVAVRMLFEPYTPTEPHWLRWVTGFFWRQGLVPARQAELAGLAGQQVSRLLPPEVIADEATRLVGEALDDPEFRRQVATALGPAVRDALPGLVRRFTPEVMTLLGHAVNDALSREHLRAFYDRVVEPLLADPDTRDRLVDATVRVLKEQAPRVVAFAKASVDRYQRTGSTLVGRMLRAATVRGAEWVGVIDWDDFDRSFRRQLESRENREQLVEVIGSLGGQLREGLVRPELQPVWETFRTAAGGFAREFVERFLTTELPDAAARMAGSNDFWHWLAHDGLDRFKPSVVEWLRAGGLRWVGERFDVTGRVGAAIRRMDVRAVHGMVDAVAAEQLGAIQVLGFVLGVMAGALLAVLL